MGSIGILAESSQETRVAATPTSVKQIIGLGYDIAVEAGAGVAASFTDESYLKGAS
jgi:NAD(P) transhydrogenase subunit alpha